MKKEKIISHKEETMAKKAKKKTAKKRPVKRKVAKRKAKMKKSGTGGVCTCGQ